jgi:hypothetical protein
MNNSKCVEIHRPGRSKALSAWSVAIAVVSGVYGATGLVAAHAQSTGATIFGWAPAGATVTVHGSTGGRRHVTANAKGRYTIGSLPLGIYTATLQKGEKTVDTRANIPLTVGRGAEVDFACDHDQCAESANGAITAP